MIYIFENLFYTKLFESSRDHKQTKQNVTYQKPLELFIWIIKHKTWNKQNVFKLYNNKIIHINNKQNKKKQKYTEQNFPKKKNLRKLETEPPTSTKEKNKNEQPKKPMNHKKRDKQKVL